jgi:hypothetical protein
MTKTELQLGTNYGEELLLCDSLEYIALHSPVSAEERTIRFMQTASILEGCVNDQPAPATEGAHRNLLRIRTWQACMPMLLCQASETEVSNDDLETVLGNIRNLLADTLTDCADMSSGARSGTTISGQLAEIAVLGALVWSSLNGRRKPDLILPATSAQDFAHSTRSGKNFDISVYRNGKHIPVQVKSSREEFMRKQRFGSTKPRGADVAKTVFVSTLVEYNNPRYAPEILADTIVKLDSSGLEYAKNILHKATESL